MSGLISHFILFAFHQILQVLTTIRYNRADLAEISIVFGDFYMNINGLACGLRSTAAPWMRISLFFSALIWQNMIHRKRNSRSLTPRGPKIGLKNRFNHYARIFAMQTTLISLQTIIYLDHRRMVILMAEESRPRLYHVVLFHKKRGKNVV